jgi:hypothetical protein
VSHGIFCESGGNGRAQAEATAQAAGDIVFTAAFRGRKLPGGVNPVLTGIEAKHHLAKAYAIPAAGIGVIQYESVHGKSSQITIPQKQILNQNQSCFCTILCK